MSDLAEPVSTDLAPENATTTGGGAPPAAEPASADESHRASLEAVMKDADKVAEKAKPAVADKDDTKADDKAPKDGESIKETAEKVVRDAPVEKVADKGSDKAAEPVKEEQGHDKRPEAPQYLSERAKAVWRNVPRELQHEITQRDRDAEEAKPRLERYEAIREFDEIAKSNGRDLRDSLVKINQFENMMKSNPIGALNAILQEIGPRKADGGKVSLLEVAQHIVNQGQEGYNQTIQQARITEQQEAQQRQMAEQQRAQQEENKKLINLAYIQPFRAANPRFDELHEHIVKFLASGIVDKSLSPPERLAEAYELAERIVPASTQSQSSQGRTLDEERRADADLSGSKSIKSSPGLVTDEEADERAKPGEDILESIQQAARKLKRA